MTPDKNFMHLLEQVQIVRSPKQLLATFGTTVLRYSVISALPEALDQCRLRTGLVTAQKPQILTPEHLQKRFEGFGNDAEGFGKALEQHYGESLKALGYVFRNELEHATVEHSPLAMMTDRIAGRIDDENQLRTTLMQAPDPIWSFAIMKFIVDLSLRSFPANVRELDERGLFNPGERERSRQRLEIERLFREAAANPPVRLKLGETLKSWGLFSEYEDRFFSLF
jgi:hypothetical protein